MLQGVVPLRQQSQSVAGGCKNSHVKKRILTIAITASKIIKTFEGVPIVYIINVVQMYKHFVEYNRHRLKKQSEVHG